ncbi:MAG: hypothetical protein V4676_03630, partial [Bacteroidota bacterium]
NVYGKHFSSKGKIALQDVTHTNVDVAAFFQTSNNLEWNARIGSVQEKYNKFGFLPKTLVFPDDSINVKFQTLRGRVGFHNINRTAFGLTYSPEIKIEAFSDGLSNSESNTTINLPLHKTIGTKFEAVVAVEVNLTNYKPENKTNVNNYWVMASPSFLYKTGPLHLQAGVRPTWDNGAFKLLPNIFVEFNTNDNLLAVQAGWNGYMRNSGFQYAANMNPWIWAPGTVYNSRIEERYAGIKGSTGDHLSYSAKISFNKVTNQPLFVNDTITGKSFLVINEADMDVVNFAGGLGYTIGEKLSVLSHITLNRYKPKVSKEAWGLLPLEWNNTLKLQVLKDLYVNTTLYAFGGPQSKSKSGEKMLQGAMDLTAGLEFKIVKNVKLWAQFNNIFNSEYQRWNQYPNYGFNFLGGVVFSFAQNK